jgi:hypothetical protein
MRSVLFYTYFYKCMTNVFSFWMEVRLPGGNFHGLGCDVKQVYFNLEAVIPTEK